MRNALLAALSVVWMGSVCAGAQQAADPCAAGPRATFDVVSVKPSESSSKSSSMRGTADGVAATASLRRMVQNAFQLRDFQLTGGPDWMSTQTWELRGKMDEPDPDMSNMSETERDALGTKRAQRLQAAIMDRFQLKCHMITKEMPIYDLVVAKGGPKLTPAPGDQKGGNSVNVNGHNLQMHAELRKIDMERLAGLLSNAVGRMVVDKTGVAGDYNATMDWAGDAPARDEAGAEGGSGPTVFTALEEQLGLKLVPAKGPVPVMVVDSVEKPAEN